MAHILLVEDDSDIMRINRTFLENAGYTVHCAESVQQAAFQLEECVPDLVLLDVMLPDGDGMDFCRILRQKTQAPVIFLTARDENDSVVMGFQSGGDDYITKPYDLNVLKARIDAQLRHSSSRDTQHPRVELPYLTIDLFAGNAVLDGNECPLPQRELQILYLLASRLGSRVSYHEIYRTIYGCDVEDSKNTIRVNISRLKKHLSMDDMSTYEIASTSEGEYVLRRVLF
ncbi:MAG: response regulator transcription factor [Oscillospiraceae bacterium]|nr:response regulator transcription factor [Oscillospiraceae bacterium]